MLPVVFWQRPVTVRPRAATVEEERALFERLAARESEPSPTTVTRMLHTIPRELLDPVANTAATSLSDALLEGVATRLRGERHLLIRQRRIDRGRPGVDPALAPGR